MSAYPSDRYVCRLPFGAQLNETRPNADAADTHARFRVWAPSSPKAELQIEYDGQTRTLDMARDAGGWFTAEAACGAGARYRYRFGETADFVPDPASRFQPEGVHGPSEVIDPLAYTWRNPQWSGRPWEEMVIYELHVGALGGYRQLAERLPKLAELGITAIELMPLNEFPGRRNWGYDGVLPFAPASAYGRPEELKALIDRAHDLGLCVLLDVVYNHFGPDGNYLAQYARPFFREDRLTPWGPAIDFRRPEVSEFFVSNALYWLLEYRFDGLRFDAVHAIADDDWLRTCASRIRAAAGPDRHVHLVLENERNTASLLREHFDAQWNDDAHNTLHVLLTGEHEGYYAAYKDAPIAKLARVLSEGFVYQGEPSPIHDGEPRGEPSAALAPTKFVMFLQNHDQVGNRAFGERLRALCEPQALRAATALLLLSPQIPLLFMEEEYGSTQPFLFFTDYGGELADAVREGRRREFSRFTSFSDPDKRARIPDPNAVQTFAMSCASCDCATEDEPAKPRTEAPSEQETWRHFYRSALAVRTKLIAPRLAGARALGAQVLQTAARQDARAVLARWRLADGETLAIALNLGSERVPLASVPDGTIVFETPPRAREQIDAGSLPEHACLAWITGDVNDYALHRETRAAATHERTS
jgi:maltooligosyltrehalose trehalohydrolase